MTSLTRTRTVWLLLLTIGYVAAGRLGLLLAVVNESTTPVWPPTGIAIAALLLCGLRVWPVVTIGAFLVNLSTSGSVAASLLIAVGNTLEAVAGAWLTQRFAGGAGAFDRIGDVFRFTVLAGAGATMIAATVGVFSLLWTGLANAQDAPSIWFTWWLGDAVGAMVMTPLVVLWSKRRVAPPRPLGLEAAMLAATLVIVSIFVFGGSPAGVARYPLHFLVTPILLWAAFRLGSRETAAAAAVVGAIAVAGTLRGWGPFASNSPNESLLLLQGFIGLTTVMMLSVAAEVGRRRTIEAQMRALNDALERRIADRTDEVRRVNERLVEAQEVAHVGSWEWDIAANRIWWSGELYRIYGVSPEAVVGYETFLARVHPDDRAHVDAAVRQALVDGRPFVFEHRVVRSDGDTRTLYAAGRVVVDSEGRPTRMVGIGHDITDRKRAEEERAQLIHEQAVRREAQEASRAKDEFLATLSHELRTPLNAALGWAAILGSLEPGDPRGARALDAIRRNLSVQARLVSDILDLARITTGELALHEEELQLPAVIDAAVETVSEAAAARGVTIEHAVRGEPFVIRGDSARIQQVLWNLLSNAIRFGREGGHVRLEAVAGGDILDITVSDDGPGIDPAFLPYVFDPFRQGDASPARQHDGLGLGLSIARHIVERHGGTIAAANGERGGAVFSVRLPARSGKTADGLSAAV